MKNLKRTHYCGEVAAAKQGKKVTVGGFVNRLRDKGGLIFIDLRDITGIVQLVFDETTKREVFEKAGSVKSEYVLMAAGILRARENINKDIATGAVEILVEDLQILSKSAPLPYDIHGEKKANEELRLKYRSLDLRSADLQKNLLLRHNLAKATRDYFYANRFVEIETPMFIKSTPEGARDFLVPSRLHPGKFYALPQSPQIYKQLLMISGFDRYIQLARCFRDEDNRADRQPEFTQIDLEMSFADVDDVLEMLEGFIKHVMREVVNIDIVTPLPRLTYDECVAKYGTDQPDTRYGMEITDITELAKQTDFTVFRDAESIRGIVAKGSAAALTRKEIDKLIEFAKGIGAKGLSYIRWHEDAPSCSFGKFVTGEQLSEICALLGCEKGDTALIAADKFRAVLRILGAMRTKTAGRLGIIPESGYNFVWITEMPFFELNDENGEWDAMHHPFTMPHDDCLPFLDSGEFGKVYAKAYDLVLNGTELCSGSIRITDFELQERMFKALRLGEEEIESKFGFLIDAYKFASPPHGGAGIGLDRLAMILCGAKNLHDVTAFPKTKNASELMSGSPGEVDAKQLDELHLKLKEQK
ncbi:MAG: aspartate--tRNA ligase [Oscillospiraceae bacterium]|jgi:aspartyl-tRNA synthetase|nr:aspartate--tRNA ligase [Oscillospiraceae bacterium]